VQYFLFHGIIQNLLNLRSGVQPVQAGIVTGWIDSVRQKDVEQSGFRVHPGERSRETRVTEA
jgi:hypothetical protein